MSLWQRIKRRAGGKVITFRPESPSLDGTGATEPRPAKFYIPDWYKKIPNRGPNGKKINPLTEEQDATVKNCVPLLDAFTSGYIQELNCDISVDRSGPSVQFIWPRQYPWEPVRPPRHPDSMRGFVSPKGYDENPFLWIQPFEFELPAGYSLLITHPFNRNDLPFQTMSAIVDTDVFPLRAEITFYLRSDFSGVIPRGTPIFQAIPVKREEWSSVFEKYEEAHTLKYVALSRNVFGGAYKSHFWQKKKYGQSAQQVDQQARCPVMHGGQEDEF